MFLDFWSGRLWRWMLRVCELWAVEVCLRCFVFTKDSGSSCVGWIVTLHKHKSFCVHSTYFLLLMIFICSMIYNRYTKIFTYINIYIYIRTYSIIVVCPLQIIQSSKILGVPVRLCAFSWEDHPILRHHAARCDECCGEANLGNDSAVCEHRSLLRPWRQKMYTFNDFDDHW